MNWLHFCLWVCGIYMLYYLTIIFMDLARARAPAGTPVNELSFSPEVLKTAEPVSRAKPQPSMIASGGRSLKETFRLARQDMLVYTRAVSF